MSAAQDMLARASAFARDVVMPGAPHWEAEQRIGREAVSPGPEPTPDDSGLPKGG